MTMIIAISFNIKMTFVLSRNNVLTELKRLDSYPRVSVDRLVLSPICLYCWPVEDKVNTPC